MNISNRKTHSYQQKIMANSILMSHDSLSVQAVYKIALSLRMNRQKTKESTPETKQKE